MTAADTETQGSRSAIWRLGAGVAFLVFALIASVFIEWVGMSTVWRDQGAAHSRQQLVSELRHLNLNLVAGAPGGPAVKSGAVGFSEWFFAVFAQQTGLAQGLRSIQDVDGLRRFSAGTGLPSPHAYAVAALNTIQTFGLKLVVVALALPIYVVFALWGVGEGLTVRALRRYRAVHESAYVFHHAKRLVWPMITLPVMAYLALPLSVSPLTLFGPCALIYGIAWVVMVSKFKKYL